MIHMTHPRAYATSVSVILYFRGVQRAGAPPCTFMHTPRPAHPQAYATSVSVYLPFYLVSSVLVHRQALLQRPGELLPKLLAAVLRSSAFLSLYIAAAFGGGSSVLSLSPGVLVTFWGHAAQGAMGLLLCARR